MGLGFFAPPVPPVSTRPAVSPVQEQVAGILADRREMMLAQHAMQLANPQAPAESTVPQVTTVTELITMAKASSDISREFADQALERADAAREELQQVKQDAGGSYEAGKQEGVSLMKTIMDAQAAQDKRMDVLVEKMTQAQLDAAAAKHQGEVAVINAKLDAVLQMKDTRIVQLEKQVESLAGKKTWEQVVLESLIKGETPPFVEKLIGPTTPDANDPERLLQLGYVQTQIQRQQLEVDRERRKMHEEAETHKTTREFLGGLAGLVTDARDYLPNLISVPRGAEVGGIAPDFPDAGAGGGQGHV